jgi:hypothetical protein
MTRTPLAPILAAAAILAVLAVTPLTALAGHSHAGTTCRTTTKKHRFVAAAQGTPAIVFGITGGNIRPWSVTINVNGAVSVDGWVTVQNKSLTSSTNTLKGLLSLAETEGFFSMRSVTRCSGVLPDVASRFISIHTSTGGKRVTVHGSCNAGFEQLYAVLQNSVGLSP